jgi:protein-S-isoprenylcysteine O-methyltransferase Ste14
VASWAAIARRIRVQSGFVFAALYLYFARPSAWSLALGAAVIIPGLIIRALASGHVTKDEQLTTSGPYAHTRNPLYLGSLILALGFALASRSWWIGAAMIVIFFAIYIPVISAEEAFLRERFPEFEEYARQVPRLWPRLGSFGNSRKFSWDLYSKHREYNATVGAVAMVVALLAKLLWISKL